MTGNSRFPTGSAWLFCPADRPERFAKAASIADVVILDLEDGVAPAAKPAAREALVSSALDPAMTVVRINPYGTPDHDLDLAALAQTPYTLVMLSKCEGADHAAALSNFDVIALVESPLGALRASDIASAAPVRALMWGAEDLIAAMGGTASRHDDGAYRHVAQHVRSTTLLAAKAHGRIALDSVFLNIADLDGLRAETRDGVAIGFDAKVAIHPSQVTVIRDVFTPTVEEIDWAQRLLSAAKGERGVFTFEGRMVDAPVLRHAEAVLRRTGRAEQ
ncbi:CoA ester lyase [Hoyosella rhizosphaerae]|nr:CoA ester lyase [Hoyosella rhizosphaerae]MBN4927583.1 CoA ester lyase [Hoyosella rhizosphaerae]